MTINVCDDIVSKMVIIEGNVPCRAKAIFEKSFTLSLSLSSFPLSPPGEKNVMNVREDWRAERRNKRNKKRKKKKKEEKKERKIGRRRGECIIIRSFDRDYRRGINE